ncbi:RES family NAD+ phosphorylase [Piscinibacter sakaiensis]|uniref:RES family NAD+ phosphorylase n=1 Tax=Piscinibacter sakaiensis TaxID=1547922 RepID=UPI0006B57D96|nr:RES family NAD+ phosphorylase [Piscinibacter sakaiensis]
MKLHDLQYLPPVTLPASQTVYRVQRTKARSGAVTVGPLKMAPIGDMSGRFAVATTATGYFAESPETAVYESLVRREAVSLSISNVASRQLLCLQTTRPVNLLDLRQHASSWPVLQSLRFPVTQEIAAGALAEGFEGVAYRSAQHYGQDCFVVFGPGLKTFKLVWRKALVLADGSMHQALVTAIRGGQIMLTP